MPLFFFRAELCYISHAISTELLFTNMATRSMHKDHLSEWLPPKVLPALVDTMHTDVALSPSLYKSRYDFVQMERHLHEVLEFLVIIVR